MQIGDGALRVRGGLKDSPLVAGQDLEPASNIGGMIGPGLQLRHDAEIGAEQRRTDFGDQLLPGAFAAILRIAAEIASDAGGARRPMTIMPISA